MFVQQQTILQNTFFKEDKYWDAYNDIRQAAESIIKVIQEKDIKKLGFIMDGTLNQKFHDSGKTFYRSIMNAL